MRVALVSPYSWSYPEGGTRHIEALAEQFWSDGHYARVLAPFDPPDRRSSLLHQGAEPQPLKAPDYLLSLVRTVGFRANGAVSNLSITPYGPATMLEELRPGRYDVVHIHEPVAPVIGWVAADRTRLPLVATLHAFSDKPFPNAVDPERAVRLAQKPFGDPLRIVFVGQPVKRKGLPVLLRAFETLREQLPAGLALIGPSPGQVSSVLRDRRGICTLGNLDDDAKRRELELADLLRVPSLGGESFGMVLTEAFAAGLPAVASDIAGYRDVVRDGINGLLVPPGDAQALAAALRELFEQPYRRSRMSLVAAAYCDAIKTPGPVNSVANSLPIPGGIGVLDAGLTAALVLYGVSPRARRRRDPHLPRDRAVGPRARRALRLPTSAATPAARRPRRHRHDFELAANTRPRRSRTLNARTVHVSLSIGPLPVHRRVR